MKLIFIIIFIFFKCIKTNAQMFIPFGFWQPLENCSTKYCPTLNVLSGTLAGTAGTTQIVNTCVDDSSAMVTLPFNFHIVGNAYRNWFVGSNTYITAGTGSSSYSGLSGGNPALPKLMLGSSDANYQRVYTKSGANYFRIRYEGNSPYNNCSSQNIIFEVTFFRPTINFQYIQVVFGPHIATSSPFGIANATAFYQTTTPFGKL